MTRVFGTAVLLLALSAVPAWGAGGGREEAVAEGVQYIDMKPSFVTNYGGTGAIHFLKADIALRVGSGEAAKAVNHHMPQLRHALVMLLSRQEEATLSSLEGKEQLRQEALAAVQQVLETEQGRSGVQDLLFTGFILQR
jgi:flagellar FliL protein